jgi:hypothetical protein
MDERKKQRRSRTPAPAPRPPVEGGASPARERARHHLRGLLATGAVTGAAAQLAACPPVVCDPMPPPLTCAAAQTTEYYLGYWVGVQAHWVLHVGNTWSIAGDVSSYATGTDRRIVFTADPVLVGATLDAVDRSATNIHFACTPTAGADEVRMDVAINCNDVADMLRLRLDISGVRDNNAGIQVHSAETEDR